MMTAAIYRHEAYLFPTALLVCCYDYSYRVLIIHRESRLACSSSPQYPSSSSFSPPPSSFTSCHPCSLLPSPPFHRPRETLTVPPTRALLYALSTKRTMIQAIIMALCALSLVSAGPHRSDGLSSRRRHHFRAIRKAAPVAAAPLQQEVPLGRRDCDEGAWQCVGVELQRESRHISTPIRIDSRLQLRRLGAHR